MVYNRFSYRPSAEQRKETIGTGTEKGRNHMKIRLFIVFTALILSFALVSAVFADETYTFEISEGFSFSDKTDISSIAISVPRVSGMADENDEILLNAHFLAKKDEIIADYKQNVEMAKANYPAGDGPHFEYKYSWNIVTDDDDHYVIWTTYLFAAGSAGEQNEFFNLDKKTGKLLDFDEDAVTSLEAIAQIREQIFQSISNANLAGADFWTEGDALDVQLGQVRYLNHWYYNKNGDLVICFDGGEIAPASRGTVYFVIGK